MRFAHVQRTGIAVVLVLSCGLLAAMSRPPATVRLSYTIRETPGDPSSPVHLRWQLEVRSLYRHHDRVAWQLTDLWIVEPAEDPTGLPRVWHDAAPIAEPWWVTHADVSSPAAAEFSAIPAWTGLAGPANHRLAALRYTLAGTPLPVEASASAAALTALTYRLQDADEQAPDRGGDDVPAEIDDEPEDIDESEDPPTGS